MGRRIKIATLGGALALLLLAAVAALLIGRTYGRESVRQWLMTELSKKTGLVVRSRSLKGSLVGDVTLEGVTVRNADGSFRAEIGRIRADYRMTELLREPHRIESLEIDRAAVDVRRGGAAGNRGGGGGASRIRPIPVDVGRIVVREGRITVDSSSVDSLHVVGSLGRGAGGARARLDTLSAVLRPKSTVSLPAGLTADLRVGEAGECSLSARGHVGGTSFEHRGAYALGEPLRGEGVLRLTPLDGGDVLRYLGSRLDTTGASANVTIRFSGERDSLAMFLEASGGVAGYEFSDVSATGLLERTTFRLDHLTGEVNQAGFTGDGFLDFAGGERNRLRLAFDHVDVSKVSPRFREGTPTDVTGVLAWEGTGRDFTNLEGSVLLTLRDSRVGAVTIRGAEVRGRALGHGIAVEESVIRTIASELRFSGYVGADGSFRGDLDGWIPSLGEFRRASGLDSLGGSAALSVQVAGNPKRFRAVGRATIDQGRAGRARAAEARLDGWFEKNGRSYSGGSETFVKRASVSGERIDSVRVALRLEDDVLYLDDLSGWRGAWLLHARGSVTSEEERKTVIFEDASLRRGDSTWAEPGRVLAWEEGNRARLEPVHFAFGGGQVWVEAEQGSDGVVHAALRVTDADLGILAGRTGLPPDLLRSVDIEAAAGGTRDTLTGTITVRSRPPGTPDLPFRLVEGSAHLEGVRIGVDSLVFHGLGEGEAVRATGTIDEGAPGAGAEVAFDIGAVRFPFEDLRFLSERLASVQGRLDGNLTMRGPLAAPALDATFTVHEALVDGYPMGTIRGDSVAVRGDSLVFVIRFDPDWGGGNRVRGRFPVRLAPEEKEFGLLPEGPMALDVVVPEGDLAFLALLTRRLDEASGSFSVDLKARGDVAAPRVDGVFEMHDAFLFPAGMSGFFERVNARFLLDEDYVTIVGFEARSRDRGRLNAWGRIDLTDLRPASYDVHFKAKEYDFILAEGVQVRFDGELALQPDTTVFRKVVPHFSGEADVKAALVEREFTSSGGPGRTSVLDPTSDPSWTCDIFLRAPSNFWIRNGTFDAEIGGEAQVRRSAEGLGALGQFDVLRGTCWIYNNEFHLRDGTVVFIDPDDLRKVQVDVTAQTDVAGERIEVRAYGDADDIQLQPTSQSGYSEGEILSALTLRSSPEDEVNSGQVLSSWFTTLASRLSRQMTRGLGDVGTIEIGTSEDLPEIRYGNYLSSDLYLGFSQKIDVGSEGAVQERSPTTENLPVPERQLLVEYRLRRSLLIQGEAGTLSDGNRFLNLDLKVRLTY